MLNDLRHGIRALRRTPGFAIAAILTLALGIGANTAIFSVVNAVLLKGLPYKDPGRLVMLHETMEHAGDATIPTSPANYRDWRTMTKSFESMTAAEIWFAVVTGREGSEQVSALRATAGLFDMLGVRPALGRTVAADEDQPGKEHVIVLSHRMWLKMFGGDPGVVGRTLRLNTEPYTVIGVMPAGFEFPTFWAGNTEFWAPLPLAARPNSRDGRSIRVFARLKPGVSIEQARAEMSGIAAQLSKAYPETNAGAGAGVQSLRDLTVRNVRVLLLVLLATVLFLLLITCANLANLLLSRSTARRREMAVRLAIGSGKARLVRLMLAESSLLAAAGGICAVAMAGWGVPLLRTALEQMSGAALPRTAEMSVDGTVLAYTAMISIVSGIAFGVAPALRASRLDLNEALKDASRGSDSAGRGRLRNALVVAEIALSVVLLAGAGLLVRSFARLVSIRPGFDAQHVLTATVPYAGSQLGEPGHRAELYRDIVARVAAVPGVESASAVNHIPIAGDDWHFDFVPEGRSYAPGDIPSALYRVIRPGYFATMRIPLLAGRDITDRDDGKAPAVAVITESTARRFWNSPEAAIGRRFRYERDGALVTVVGVVGNIAQTDLRNAPTSEFFIPHPQSGVYMNIPAPFFYLTLVVRTKGDPLAIVEEVRREVRAIDPGLALNDVLPMDAVLGRSLWQARLSMSVVGCFAGLAMLLACIGVYGVISYAVSQRTREFGVRLALGAAPGDLLRTVLRDGAMLAGIGVAIGIAGAAAVTRLMSSLLFETAPRDPVSFAAAVGAIAVIALIASLLPALRAMRVDPITALRYE